MGREKRRERIQKSSLNEEKERGEERREDQMRRRQRRESRDRAALASPLLPFFSLLTLFIHSRFTTQA